ncbi:uncharacterized protein F4822DRAFT_407810 [Hypoxylon trugodes]|uniref:uncharacterized protein n=1 Tax=Hypoxylon trugodes TaxID=326681 RepID=UPI002190F35F|nr:uncharacterized protein F4822DRAFT_407810 [Hypoxylon trugodes]KAI1387860.1 hypothetical protein F4822DRAFT_407810 [Hypoxylon trugodes]
MPSSSSYEPSNRHYRPRNWHRTYSVRVELLDDDDDDGYTRSRETGTRPDGPRRGRSAPTTSGGTNTRPSQFRESSRVRRSSATATLGRNEHPQSTGQQHTSARDRQKGTTSRTSQASRREDKGYFSATDDVRSQTSTPRASRSHRPEASQPKHSAWRTPTYDQPPTARRPSSQNRWSTGHHSYRSTQTQTDGRGCDRCVTPHQHSSVDGRSMRYPSENIISYPAPIPERLHSIHSTQLARDQGGLEYHGRYRDHERRRSWWQLIPLICLTFGRSREI